MDSLFLAKTCYAYIILNNLNCSEQFEQYCYLYIIGLVLIHNTM